MYVLQPANQPTKHPSFGIHFTLPWHIFEHCTAALSSCVGFSCGCCMDVDYGSSSVPTLCGVRMSFGSSQALRVTSYIFTLRKRIASSHLRPRMPKAWVGILEEKFQKTAKSCHVTFLAPEVLPSVGFSFFWSEKRLKISKSEQHLIPCCWPCLVWGWPLWDIKRVFQEGVNLEEGRNRGSLRGTGTDMLDQRPGARVWFGSTNWGTFCSNTALPRRGCPADVQRHGSTREHSLLSNNWTHVGCRCLQGTPIHVSAKECRWAWLILSARHGITVPLVGRSSSYFSQQVTAQSFDTHMETWKGRHAA